MTLPRSVVLGAVALILALAGAVVVMVIDDDGMMSGADGGRMMQMERSGQMVDMMNDHAELMDSMRSDASPTMRRQMDADEMSEMMRSGEMADLMQEHRADMMRMMHG